MNKLKSIGVSLALSVAALSAFSQNSLTQPVKNVNGRLVFTSMRAVQTVRTKLETDCAAYRDDRPSPADGVFQDDDPVLDIFESGLNFKSLRRLSLESEFKQLESGVDPFALKWLSPIRDKFTATFLNKDQLLQVQDTVYWFKTDQTVIKVPAASEKTLLSLLGGANPLSFSNVTVLSTANKPVKTGELCVVDFSFSGNLVGNTVSFTVTTPAVSGTAYQWNFGDGNTSTQANPTNTYANSGVYTVTLNISRGDTCFATKQYTITVNQNCMAMFSSQPIPGQPGGISFHGTSLSPTSVTSWTWDFGNGQTGTGQNPTHTYSCDGTYRVQLTIVTANGCRATASHNITITSLRCCDKDIDPNETKFTYTTPDGQHKFEGNAEDWQPVLWTWTRKMNAEMHHWKKKTSGGWKKDKANMRIDFEGNVYVKDATGCLCKQPLPIGSTTSANVKKIELNKNVGQDFKTAQNDVWKAKFYYNGALIKTLDNSNIPIQCN